MPFVTKELRPELWSDLERLFGESGACGGCWCMSWRQERGEKWEDVKGSLAKRRLSLLVKAEKAHGILAYDGGEPVGWCAFDRRVDFAKLNRSPSLACADAERVWSTPCFFVKRSHRGKGMAGVLLRAALSAMKSYGATVVEAYPVKPHPAGKTIPHAFAWTGTRSLFEAAGFRIVGNRNGGKQRVRLEL